jgi:hypothetical protein
VQKNGITKNLKWGQKNEEAKGKRGGGEDPFSGGGVKHTDCRSVAWIRFNRFIFIIFFVFFGCTVLIASTMMTTTEKSAKKWLS